MNPGFYSLQMNITGGVDASEFAFHAGRFWRVSAALYVVDVLLNLFVLANEENQ
ncbi:MAG: hypothetical protein Q8R92_15850 [Deltaproteobacteria bacterium]|nr:hypothetical protein [Deltaproteobacteria bacterium]